MATALGAGASRGAAQAGEISAYAKAVAESQDRQLDEALRYARQAVREHPDHVDAYVLLGELYDQRRELGYS